MKIRTGFIELRTEAGGKTFMDTIMNLQVP
jgi:hypothetical protein